MPAHGAESRKATLATLLASLGVASGAVAGNIYDAPYANQADVRIFRVDHENEADLCVYVAKYSNQARDKDEVWHYVEYANQAGWKTSNRYRGMFK